MADAYYCTSLRCLSEHEYLSPVTSAPRLHLPLDAARPRSCTHISHRCQLQCSCRYRKCTFRTHIRQRRDTSLQPDAPQPSVRRPSCALAFAVCASLLDFVCDRSHDLDAHAMPPLQTCPHQARQDITSICSPSLTAQPCQHQLGHCPPATLDPRSSTIQHTHCLLRFSRVSSPTDVSRAP